MSVNRTGASATLLPDGRVLVAGGGTATAEVYDPSTGNWTLTGQMHTARDSHTATSVQTPACTGRAGTLCGFITTVLVAGGDATGTSELYNPQTGTWSLTGSLSGMRSRHTATLLPSGWVLVAGGHKASGTLNTAELYDPLTGMWTAAPNMTEMRENFSATLISVQGQPRVLAAGGFGFSIGVHTAELYTPF
jgi:WD40 repeat protein